MTQENFSITGIIEKFFTVSTGFLGALLVLVISAIYLAAQPELHRLGLIKLFPPRLHAQAAKKSIISEIRSGSGLLDSSSKWF